MSEETIFMVAVIIFFVMPLLAIFVPVFVAHRERNGETPIDRLGSQDVDQRINR